MPTIPQNYLADTNGNLNTVFTFSRMDGDRAVFGCNGCGNQEQYWTMNQGVNMPDDGVARDWFEEMARLARLTPPPPPFVPPITPVIVIPDTPTTPVVIVPSDPGPSHPTPVPEPATAALFAGSCILAMAWRWLF